MTFLASKNSAAKNISKGHQGRNSVFCLLILLALLQVVVSWLEHPTTTSATKLHSQNKSNNHQNNLLMTATDIETTTALEVDNDTNSNIVTKQKKRLICIRHARSEGNEFMARPGNQWGDPTFCDDASLIDAKLTETGMKQVQDELLPKFLVSSKDDSNKEYKELLQEVDLVLISPLTRTQQTFQYGVLPALEKLRPDRMPTMLAHPWSTERVYTASDTGRSVSDLSKEFPWVDWSLLHENHNDNNHHHQEWWYSHTHDPAAAANYQEWRPYGEGQWYAVPGEPLDAFQERMKRLEDWIAAREEHTILLVAHWGVLRYLTGGYDTENCEVTILKDWTPLHQQQKKEQNEGEEQ